jgi:hypothetical protein
MILKKQFSHRGHRVHRGGVFIGNSLSPNSVHPAFQCAAILNMKMQFSVTSVSLWQLKGY